jgi:hypothetical protein
MSSPAPEGALIRLRPRALTEAQKRCGPAGAAERQRHGEILPENTTWVYQGNT